MNKRLLLELDRLGANPADEVWRWLLLAGPHGSSFTWSQTTSEPAGYVGLEHLREIIAAKAVQDSDFRSRASVIARRALDSRDTDIVRRGLQVIGALALVDATSKVDELVRDPDSKVTADARACLFLLRQRLS